MPRSAKHSSASFAKGHFFRLGVTLRKKGGGILTVSQLFSTLPKTEKGEGELRTDKPETRGFLFSSSLSLFWTDARFARVRGKVARFGFRIKKVWKYAGNSLAVLHGFYYIPPPLTASKKTQLNMRSDGRGKIIAEVDESRARREKAQKRSPVPPSMNHPCRRLTQVSQLFPSPSSLFFFRVKEAAFL